MMAGKSGNGWIDGIKEEHPPKSDHNCEYFEDKTKFITELLQIFYVVQLRWFPGNENLQCSPRIC